MPSPGTPSSWASGQLLQRAGEGWSGSLGTEHKGLVNPGNNVLIQEHSERHPPTHTPPRTWAAEASGHGRFTRAGSRHGHVSSAPHLPVSTEDPA